MSLVATWLGQSGFVIEAEGRTVVIDPWLSPAPSRATPPPDIATIPARIDAILITHGHGDHLDLPGLDAISRHASIGRIVAPIPHLGTIAARLPGIPLTGVKPSMQLSTPMALWVTPAWHGVDIDDGYSAGIDSEGLSPQVGYVFELGAVRLYHAGDTIAARELADHVSALAPEVAFLPINGRDEKRERRGILGNMNEGEAADFAAEVGISTVIPLHYDAVTGNLSDVGAMARLAAARGVHVVVPTRDKPFGISSARQAPAPTLPPCLTISSS